DYWLQNRDGGFNFFTAEWNGVEIPGSALTDAGPFGYTEFTFDVLASSATSKLTFLGYHQSGNRYLLDDISLTDAAAATPEPASLTLLGAGLLAISGFLLRRWRRGLSESQRSCGGPFRRQFAQQLDQLLTAQTAERFRFRVDLHPGVGFGSIVAIHNASVR